jgi:hypothetical protein
MNAFREAKQFQIKYIIYSKYYKNYNFNINNYFFHFYRKFITINMIKAFLNIKIPHHMRLLYKLMLFLLLQEEL